MKRFLRHHWLDLLILLLFITGIMLLIAGFLHSHNGVPDIVI